MRRLKRILCSMGLKSALLLCVLLLNITVLFLLSKTIEESAYSQLSAPRFSEDLIKEGNTYRLEGDWAEFLEQNDCWALLMDHEGQVIWSLRKPESIPDHFTVGDVAAMTRWYIEDYPVKVWRRDDGLLVLAAPKYEVAKYDFYYSTQNMALAVLWPPGLLLINIVVLMVLSIRSLKKDFRRRSDARTLWVAGVSHDIRTPLSVVLGYAGQMEDNPELGAPFREKAGIIRAQSERIRELVSDLNLSNKLDNGLYPMEKSDFSPVALARQVVIDLLNREEERIEIDFAADEAAARLMVKGDPALVRRMLENLLNNSVRHNPSGCAMGLSVRVGRFKTCVIEVWDDGKGLDKAQLRKLNHPSLDRNLPEHGLGLRLVYQIARAHRGRARFGLSESGGFKCTIVLPAWGKTKK